MSGKIMFIILISLGFSTLYTCYFYVAKATTLVQGHITEDTIWSIENSPYVVVNDIIVEAGVKLTITPGVVVKFANGTNLIIDGTLIACGNVTQRIEFTSNSTIPISGDWGGIKFRSSSVGSILNWTILEYGGRDWYDAWAIYADGSDVSILNSEIQHNVYAVQNRDGSILVVQNCNFMNNTYGIYSESNTKIYESTFSDNEEGVRLGGASVEVYSSNFSRNTLAIREFVDGSYLYIIDCKITDNSHGICWVSSIELSQSMISNNLGTGIVCHDWDSFQVTNCTISSNKQSGITCDGYNPAQKHIHFCSIFNNTPYDVVNNLEYGFDINATSNWWGTENETVIGEKIYDYYDNYNYSKVIFKPYLNEPAIIPEFPSFLILPLFMLTTLLAVTVHKRKRSLDA